MSDRLNGVERYRYDDLIFEIPWKEDNVNSDMVVHRDETKLPYPATPEKLLEHHKKKMLKVVILHRTNWELAYSINSRAVVWKKSMGDVVFGEPEPKDL